MTSISLAPIVAGSVMGTGALIIRRSVAPVPPALDTVLARLSGSSRTVPWWRRLPDPLVGRDEDRAILGRSSPDQVASWTTAIVLSGVLLTVLGFGSSVAGVAWDPGVAAVVGILVLGAAAVIPGARLRQLAANRRHAASQSLSAYLDLVTVLLAGGAGVETALVAAADIAEGPFFSAVRNELTRSRALRRSPWVGLGDLGRRWGLDELVELASTVELAGEQGARVRTSLMVRAASLRDRQLALIEARAQSATERMGLPMVLVFVGFVVLLGYPALSLVVGGL